MNSVLSLTRLKFLSSYARKKKSDDEGKEEEQEEQEVSTINDMENNLHAR